MYLHFITKLSAAILPLMLLGCESLIGTNPINPGNTTNNNDTIIAAPESQVMKPGSGFNGETLEPGQIGSGPGSDAKVIARYNVVPYQDFDILFNVGVPAFHINEVDRVEFAVEGGAWISVREMTLNPKTNTYEYWAQMRARDFAQAGPIEVRAIAYPKNAGRPRYIGKLLLNVFPAGIPTPQIRYVSATDDGGNDDNDGLTPDMAMRTIGAAVRSIGDVQGNADGGIVYLLPGDHDYGAASNTQTIHRFVTITKAPGSARSEVRIITSNIGGNGIDTKLVRVTNLTIRATLEGRGSVDQYIWADQCDFIGNGRETKIGPEGPNQVATDGHGQFFHQLDRWVTNSTVRNNYAAFEGTLLTRNVQASNIGSEAFGGGSKLVINCSVDGIDRGAIGGDWHPDVFEITGSGNAVNYIIYGLNATNVKAQGIFMKERSLIQDVAFVNVAIEIINGENNHIHDIPRVDHLLLHHVTFPTRSFWFRAESGTTMTYTNISVKNSVFNEFNIDSAVDIQNRTYFDNNHFINRSDIAGTNFTLNNPLFQNVSSDDFSPADQSPLCWSKRQDLVSDPPQKLIPADFYGTPRTANLCMGAFQ